MTDSLAPTAGGFPPATTGSATAGWRDVVAGVMAGESAGVRYLLLLRFLVLNVVAGALLAAAWMKGWLALVLAGDSTGLVVVIALVFAFGLASCAEKVLATSRELNGLKAPCGTRTPRAARYLEAISGLDGQGRALAASALKLKLAGRIGAVRHIANSLVFLGLIGTVIGFIIALSGVDATHAADVEAIGPMVSTLISGMSVALYTTLVGAILNIWLMINYRLLEGGTITLLGAIVELGERHARP